MKAEEKKMWKNQLKSNNIAKFLILIVIPIILICACFSISPVKAATLQPQDTQYLEMRAVEIKEVEGEGKQLIFELWAHDIDFKGFDVRFAYDSSNYQPSNITTNVTTDDETEYFAFEAEFQGKLDMFTIPYTGTTDAIRAVVSFDPPVDDSTHIQDETLISSGTDVLLGKMSFKMLADTLDLTGFYLIEDSDSSPTTGIKINIDVTDCYEAQSTFRFTDKTASKDATLNNIIISTGIIDTDNPDNSTYKEYDLTPTFDKDTKEYTLELNEYIDKMNIKAELSDPNSTMKIKVPKRDENGDLVYESDGTTIVYEEKDLVDNVETEFILNELGEQDTIIEIIVTAQDGTTSETYKVTIHRPYGTIIGSIYTSPTVSTTGIYKSDIRVYKSDEVSDAIDWSTIQTGATDDLHDRLLALNFENYETKDDGTYEIYVIPGMYDILLDKPGYLDHIYRSKEVQEGTTVDLGYKELLAGDINKDGAIQILDLTMINNLYGCNSTDSGYDIKYDFNEDLQIQMLDMTFVISNYSQAREIIN